MGDSIFADVVVLPPIPGKETLTYSVPREMNGAVEVGARVLVPVGKRREAGVVAAIHSSQPPAAIRAKLKPIDSILDPEPALTNEVIELCRWAARYYCAALGELVGAALPTGLKICTDRILELSRPIAAEKTAALSERERTLVEMIERRGALSTRALAGCGQPRNFRSALSSLRAKGIVTLREKTRGRGGRGSGKEWFHIATKLAPAQLQRLAARCPAQYRLYGILCERGAPVARNELTALASTAACRGLMGKGVIAPAPPPRPPAQDLPHFAGPSLTEEQRMATEAIGAALNGPVFSVFLLHGVTGSGKTEVYLRAAERAVANGLSAIMLVPEIGLTHQLARRIEERFPGKLAILHSALPHRERLAEWQRIARGEATVVVGARSAVFAPVTRLGLLIVDEEHDPSYKQDEAPRYNAKDLAIVRAKQAGCPVILGSATPSLESFQRAAEGRYRLLNLPRRVMERALPVVEVIDLRQTGPSSRPKQQGREDSDEAYLLSPALVGELEKTLQAGEQSLLFLNRRGFANYLQCLRCGEPVACPNCSVTLTLHASRRILLCHHCNHSRLPLTRCPHCQEESLRALGGGTERIESALRRLLPRARIERLDKDTTAKRGSLPAILARWEKHEIDILIGTQMVTKGHDIPAVTLVGVVLADVALGIPDFRASERTFQLLAQVAGRAGRGSQPGKVVVQTLRPAHPSITAARTHAYESFAQRELAERKSLGYPPFGRLALVRVESRQPTAAERGAAAVGEWLRQAGARTVKVTGPAPAPLERLRGMYRWHLMLRSSARPELGRSLGRIPDLWRRSPHRRSCRLVIDVDPVSML